MQTVELKTLKITIELVANGLNGSANLVITNLFRDVVVKYKYN